MFQVKTSTILKSCLILFIGICIGHITSMILTFELSDIEKKASLLKNIFYFGSEKNLTALFSSALFILLGCYFRAIATVVTTNQTYWKAISYLAVFLACDEWFAIHDAVLNIYGMGPLGIPIWVWVYGSLAVLLFVRSIPFLKSIPPMLMTYLIVSAAIYIAGSALMEAVTYSYSDSNSLLENIGWFFEDGLEMGGVLVMIFGATTWLTTQKTTTLAFKKAPTLIIFAIVIIDLVISHTSIIT